MYKDTDVFPHFCDQGKTDFKNVVYIYISIYIYFLSVALPLLYYWSVLRALLGGRYLHRPPCQLSATERPKKHGRYLHRPPCQLGAADRRKKKLDWLQHVCLDSAALLGRLSQIELASLQVFDCAVRSCLLHSIWTVAASVVLTVAICFHTVGPSVVLGWLVRRFTHTIGTTLAWLWQVVHPSSGTKWLLHCILRHQRLLSLFLSTIPTSMYTDAFHFVTFLTSIQYSQLCLDGGPCWPLLGGTEVCWHGVCSTQWVHAGQRWCGLYAQWQAMAGGGRGGHGKSKNHSWEQVAQLRAHQRPSRHFSTRVCQGQWFRLSHFLWASMVPCLGTLAKVSLSAGSLSVCRC